MIYQVNGYNTEPTYFDDSKIATAQADAQSLLVKNQQEALIQNAVRFSICATFIDGNNTVWREVQESDPDDTICQVLDTFTGTYTQVNSKTEAYALNEQKKQAFLASVKLDKVYEVDVMPDKVTISGVAQLPGA